MPRTVLTIAVAVMLLQPICIQAQDRPVPIEEAARSPEGLIRGLYDMVSFGPGPEPDWTMFRQVFLTDALLIVAPSRTRSMRQMDVDGFIQDWKDFFRDAGLTEKGFTETIATLDLTQFGGMAHAFVIFEPRIGGTEQARPIRGLDSIELAWDGERWWVASITTDFEGPGKTIPQKIGQGG